MIRSYYRCCCINEPVIFIHCVHLKSTLEHWFHALLKVCFNRDDTVPLSGQQNSYSFTCISYMYMYILFYLKGTSVSSRSEQTFNMAWNQCPSLRWTQWLKITGSFMQQHGLIMWSITYICTCTLIPCPVDQGDIVPLTPATLFISSDFCNFVRYVHVCNNKLYLCYQSWHPNTYGSTDL